MKMFLRIFFHGMLRMLTAFVMLIIACFFRLGGSKFCFHGNYKIYFFFHLFCCYLSYSHFDPVYPFQSVPVNSIFISLFILLQPLKIINKKDEGISLYYNSK